MGFFKKRLSGTMVHKSGTAKENAAKISTFQPVKLSNETPNRSIYVKGRMTP